MTSEPNPSFILTLRALDMLGLTIEGSAPVTDLHADHDDFDVTLSIGEGLDLRIQLDTKDNLFALSAQVKRAEPTSDHFKLALRMNRVLPSYLRFAFDENSSVFELQREIQARTADSEALGIAIAEIIGVAADFMTAKLLPPDASPAPDPQDAQNLLIRG